MLCKKCLTENSSNEKICTNCGASLEDVNEAEITEIPLDEVVDEIVEIEDDTTVEEEISAVEEEIEDDDVSEEPKKRKVGAIIALIAAVIVAIAALVLTAAHFLLPNGIESLVEMVIGSSSDYVDRSDYAISYVKDGSLYMYEDGNSAKISEPLTTEEGMTSLYSHTTLQSSDGKTTFFIENYSLDTYAGDLYYTNNGKDKVKIDDGVLQNFVIDKKGKKIMYLKNVDIDTASGTLYIAEVGSDPVEVAKNVQYGTFMFSTNGKYVVFISDLDQATTMGSLKFMTVKNKEIVDVDTNVIYAYKVSDSGEIIYSKDYNIETYTCDLYYKSIKAEPELIASGISDSYVMLDEDSSKTAFVEYIQDEDAETYNFKLKAPGKETETIMDDIIGFLRVNVTDENFLIAKMPEGEEYVGAGGANPNMWVKKKGEVAALVAENILSPSHAVPSSDFSEIVYLNNYDSTTGTGDLAIAKTGENNTSTPIASGVSTFYATEKLDLVVYLSDIDTETGNGTLYAYVKGETEKIAENVSSINIQLSHDGKAVIYLADVDMTNNTGKLYCAFESKLSESELIDSDVVIDFYVRGKNSVIYNKNLNSETYTTDLYHWNGKESAKIDSGVELVLFEN